MTNQAAGGRSQLDGAEAAPARRRLGRRHGRRAVRVGALAAALWLALGAQAAAACRPGADEPVRTQATGLSVPTTGSITVTYTTRFAEAATVTVVPAGAPAGAPIASAQARSGHAVTLADLAPGAYLVIIEDSGEPIEVDGGVISGATLVSSPRLELHAGESIRLACTPEGCTLS